MEPNSPDLNNQPGQTTQQGSQGPFKFNKFKISISLFALFCIIILFAGGYFALAYVQNLWPFGIKNPTPVPLLSQKPTPSFSETPFPSYSESPSPIFSESPSPSPSPIDYLLQVKWADELIKDETICPYPERCEGDYYIAGDVLNGEYKGEKLYLKVISEMGGYSFEHVIFHDGQEIQAESVKGLTEAEVPKVIDFPGTKYKLQGGYSSSLFSEEVLDKKLFNNSVLGDAYLAKNSGCILFELPDHTSVSYDFVLPFFNDSGLLDFKFDDGQQNKEEYELGFYGFVCLSSNVVLEQDLKPTERLILAGTTPDGEELYKIKDQNDQVLQELYNDKDTAAYYNDAGKNKYTYQQFISYNPYLYWKGPMGNWVQFINKRFSRMAEMAKPVIYLYPESKINLEVKVNPNGGLTYAEPAFGNGWEIEVDPEGRITDLKTGIGYEYLFWEGLGIQYPEIHQGWVLEKTEIASFLTEKLHYLGLDEKEINEFEAYWVPRLSEKPYYEISFLSKFQFDELAPLSISPVQPKILIRVMMTVKGLDKKIDLPEQKLIKAPQRAGFTVVEWGGALLK